MIFFPVEGGKPQVFFCEKSPYASLEKIQRIMQKESISQEEKPRIPQEYPRHHKKKRKLQLMKRRTFPMASSVKPNIIIDQPASKHSYAHKPKRSLRRNPIQKGSPFPRKRYCRERTKNTKTLMRRILQPTPPLCRCQQLRNLSRSESICTSTRSVAMRIKCHAYILPGAPCIAL